MNRAGSARRAPGLTAARRDGCTSRGDRHSSPRIVSAMPERIAIPQPFDFQKTLGKFFPRPQAGATSLRHPKPNKGEVNE